MIPGASPTTMQHPPPDRAYTPAVHQQHVRVQHDLDQDQGRIQHAVAEEQERQRDGER